MNNIRDDQLRALRFYLIEFQARQCQLHRCLQNLQFHGWPETEELRKTLASFMPQVDQTKQNVDKEIAKRDAEREEKLKQEREKRAKQTEALPRVNNYANAGEWIRRNGNLYVCDDSGKYILVCEQLHLPFGAKPGTICTWNLDDGTFVEIIYSNMGKWWIVDRD